MKLFFLVTLALVVMALAEGYPTKVEKRSPEKHDEWKLKIKRDATSDKKRELTSGMSP